MQDEIFFSDKFRWVVGGRVDKFSSIQDAVFSPRTTLLLKPVDRDHTLRLSFNRAFRAPSLINNHVQTVVLTDVNLSAISPALARFILPVGVIGNPNLTQEKLTAYEIGYTGRLKNRATLSAAVYWNTTKDGIYFTQVARYTPANPPPTWPAAIPPIVIGLIPDPGLPSLFSYRNLGQVKDKGLELGIDVAVTNVWARS